jgi:hypothetical protein
MGDPKAIDLTGIAARLAEAPTMSELPAIVDVEKSLPQNPPEAIQTQFVGLSYHAAFGEAASFVSIADQWHRRHTGAGLSSLSRCIDFGSGWGRITRMLLTQMEPTSIYALDVDSQMTALINTTLPGVNAITVPSAPPIPFADSSMNSALAFSVFSHLAPQIHDAWAAEFARMIEPGGMVFFTVLDEVFLQQVANAKKAVASGKADDFAKGMAELFDDVDATIAGFKRGEPTYAGIGGGGVRTGDFYGWAALPKSYVGRVWNAVGFDIVEWVPSGVLFPQAMVGLVRRGSNRPPVRTGLFGRLGKS